MAHIAELSGSFDAPLPHIGEEVLQAAIDDFINQRRWPGRDEMVSLGDISIDLDGEQIAISLSVASETTRPSTPDEPLLPFGPVETVLSTEKNDETGCIETRVRRFAIGLDIERLHDAEASIVTPTGITLHIETDEDSSRNHTVLGREDSGVSSLFPSDMLPQQLGNADITVRRVS